MNPRLRRWANPTLLTLFLLTALGLGGRAYYHYCFPYGWSHCCDIGLMMGLRRYAEDHGGRLPSGEKTPEASLSLLYPTYADANLLRGKTVPLEAVESILAGGGRLGPETCGWHYVEGLTLKDDTRIAVFWDKARLGHNGQRHDGETTVWRLGHYRDDIPDADWPAFLKEQEKLLAERKTKPDKPADEASTRQAPAVRTPPLNR